MNLADAQVINMVNAPHERRAREAECRLKKMQARPARRRAIKKRNAAMNAFLWLVVKLELYLLAGGVMIIALGWGWIEADLGVIGLICCMVGGLIELWRSFWRR